MLKLAANGAVADVARNLFFLHLLDDLGLDYEVPSYFNPKMTSHGTDLFHAFGEAKRPDYRWLIAGNS